MNAPDTVHGLKDLTGLAEYGLWSALLLVPKVESARDVELVSRVMGYSPAPSQVWALIESPRAIQNLASILRAPELAGVVFGAADYAAEAGCKITSRAVWYPRVMLAAAAAAVGLPAVDSPYFSLHELDGLRREAEEAAELGFVGRWPLPTHRSSALVACLAHVVSLSTTARGRARPRPLSTVTARCGSGM